MCEEHTCNVKSSCYRYIAVPNKIHQAMFKDRLAPTGKDCEYYWEVSKERADELIKRRK